MSVLHPFPDESEDAKQERKSETTIHDFVATPTQVGSAVTMLGGFIQRKDSSELFVHGLFSMGGTIQK